MNKLLKSTLIAGGVMGAFFASSDANAQAFNVVIDEIELVSDADNYISTAATVYKPSVGVGAATTTTVDFFSDSLERYNLEKPSVDVYESMIIHFTTAEVSGSAAGITNIDLLTDYDTALFHAYGGRNILVFGNRGAGAQSVATITGATTAIAMQPVVVAANSFSVPEFNWNFPSSSVEEDATDVNLVSNLAPYTLAKNVDSSDVPDFMLEVDPSAFDGVSGFTSGTSRITVGLFNDTDLGPRPMFSQRFRPSAQDDSSDLELITFYDVPEGNIVPIAWFDADSDTMLDQGEFVTMHNFTVATAVNTVAAADVSYTGDNGILDETAIAFGYRDFSLRIPMGDLDGATAALAPADATFNASGLLVTDAGAGPLATSTWASTSGTALLQVGYDVFDDGATQVTRDFTLAIGYGEETGNGDATIDSGEAFHVVMANAAADDLSGVTFASATELLTVSGIPFTSFTTVSADNVGEFNITLNATDDTTPTTTATGLTITEVGGGGGETEAPVAGSITVVVGDGDGVDTDGLADVLDLGTL